MPQRRIRSKAIRRRPDGGFTLVELMIVVAIIGLLAAVAISQYSVFVSRARLAEIVQLAREDIGRLRSYFQLNGTIPEDPAAAGINTSAARSAYLTADITIAWSGTAAQLLYAVNVGDVSGQLQYQGVPAGSDLVFSCTSPDLPLRHLPANCR